MSETFEVRVPDIGTEAEVDVVEVLAAPGDPIEEEQGLVTLESDKASMELPSPKAGVVDSVEVAVGDKVKEGSLIAVLRLQDAAVEGATASKPDSGADGASSAEPATSRARVPAAGEDAIERGSGSDDVDVEVVVLGSGPGGYTAAFRAADLGKSVVLVERYASLGGVCLNVGCIPSKALLHVASVIEEASQLGEHGVSFGEPSLDLDKLRDWKNQVVGRLTGGIRQMAKQRKVRVLTGTGRFVSPHEMLVETGEGATRVRFEHAIIAAGSQAAQIPGWPYDDPRVMDSTDALELTHVPERLLVVGGGIIGLEMAAVYSALGSRTTVVELLDGLMPGVDRDLVRRFERVVKSRYENIFVGTKLTAMTATDAGIEVTMEGEKAPARDVFDGVLVAVGRKPNGKNIGAEAAGVRVDEHGFIPVDNRMRTNVAHIFAIGDITGNPMLAHKASHEGKVAAEVIAGEKSAFDARVIPSVAYTDPELAWVGVTETEASEQGLDLGKGVFPWAASGRSLSLGRDEGMTKLLFDPSTGRLVGAGIVGPNAGDLIAEAALAIEMGCDAQDIGLTIHPHPTLSETIAFAAEVFEGTVTDLYLPKRTS